MAERKYSVAEIDRMRALVEWADMGNFSGAYVMGETQVMRVEERLRTYMLNGTDPEELEKIARR